MKRKTLKTMNPVEAHQHYVNVVLGRYAEADALDEAAAIAPRKVQRQIKRLADEKWKRASKYANPQLFHVRAAKERLEKHGVGVAAAYLRAHGWDAEVAHSILFDGKPMPKLPRKPVTLPEGWDDPRSEWYEVYHG